MKTFIELSMERRGQHVVNYDMGKEFNWISVFGKNKALWWLPINSGLGAPLGDGIIIPRIQPFIRQNEDVNINN